MIFDEMEKNNEKKKAYEKEIKKTLIERNNSTNMDFIKTLNLVEFCCWMVVCNSQLLKKFGITLTTKQKNKMVYMYLGWFKKKEDKFDIFGKKELIDIDFGTIKDMEDDIFF